MKDLILLTYEVAPRGVVGKKCLGVGGRRVQLSNTGVVVSVLRHGTHWRGGAGLAFLCRCPVGPSSYLLCNDDKREEKNPR